MKTPERKDPTGPARSEEWPAEIERTARYYGVPIGVRSEKLPPFGVAAYEVRPVQANA